MERREKKPSKKDKERSVKKPVEDKLSEPGGRAEDSKAFPWEGVVGIGTFLYICLGRLPLVGEIVLDDSFITYQFSRNLVDYGQFVFNPGERVLATSTPLFALLLTPFYLMNGDLFYVAPVLNIVFDCLIAFFAYRVIRKIFPHQPLIIFAWFALLYFADYRALRSSAGGMETSFYVWLILLMIWLALRESWILAGIVGGLLFMTRPDGVLITGVVFLYYLVQKRQIPFRSAIACALTIAPWLIFAVIYYGNPIPSGVWAKIVINESFYTPLARKLVKIYFPDNDTIFLSGTLLGLMGMGYAGYRVWKDKSWSLAILPVFFVLYNLGMVMTRNHYNWFWYWVPLLPPLYIYAGYVVAELTRRFKSARIIPLMAAAVMLVYFLGFHLPTQIKWVKARSIGWANGVKAPSLWIAKNSPEHSTVMCMTIGIPAYYSHRRVIDPLGIGTPELLKDWPGKDKANLEALRRTNPDYYLAYEPMDQGYEELQDKYILAAHLILPVLLINKNETFLYRKIGLPAPKNANPK